MSMELIKPTQPTCKGCEGPLKPTDHDGCCSTTCAHLCGEKSMGEDDG